MNDGLPSAEESSDDGATLVTAKLPLRSRKQQLFAATSDVRTPEHLQRLLNTIEALREESGDNVQKLKAWLHAQQQEVHAWIRKQQPVPQRRLEAVHAIVSHLHNGSGHLAWGLDELQRLDESAVLRLLPQLCDALVLGSSSLPHSDRVVLHRFLLRLCSSSQHAVLRVCWYLRAMMQPSPAPAPASGTSSPVIGGHRRNPSGSGHRRSASGGLGTHRRTASGGALGTHRRTGSGNVIFTPASADARAAHALALIHQLEETLRTAPVLPTSSPDTAPHEASAAPTPEAARAPTTPPAQHPEVAGAGSVAPLLEVNRLLHLRLSLALVSRVNDVCAALVQLPRESRAEALRAGLSQLKPEAVCGVWLPSAEAALKDHAVQSLLPHEAVAISTNKHCPVILFVLVLLPQPRGSTANSPQRPSRERINSAVDWSFLQLGPLGGPPWPHWRREVERDSERLSSLGAALCANSTDATRELPSAALTPSYARSADSSGGACSVSGGGGSGSGGCSSCSAGGANTLLSARQQAAGDLSLMSVQAARQSSREMVSCARQLCQSLSVASTAGAAAAAASGSAANASDGVGATPTPVAEELRSHADADTTPAGCSVRIRCEPSPACDAGPSLVPRSGGCLSTEASAYGSECSAAPTTRGATFASTAAAEAAPLRPPPAKTAADALPPIEVPLVQDAQPAAYPDEPPMFDPEMDGEQAQRLRQVFGERFEEKHARLTNLHQRTAGCRPPAGFCYRVLPCLVKTGDSMLQEQFAIQLIRTFQDIFDASRLSLDLHPYDVVATAPDAGMVQLVSNAASIDSLKRRNPMHPSLSDLFVLLYGPRASRQHKRATRNFCHSAAAWAIVCYLLQIKDRHNGNILLHADGYLVHIDFGFLLSNSPGGNMNFESAPFKLTSEHVQLMGGMRSAVFSKFRELVIKGFLAARKHADKILLLAQLTFEGAGRDMPCFGAGRDALEALRGRFQLNLTRWQCARFVNDMINRSLDHWTTTCYDKYQRCWLGIM